MRDLHAALPGPIVPAATDAGDRSATAGDAQLRRATAWISVAGVVTALLIAAGVLAFIGLRDRSPARSSPATQAPQLIRAGVQVIASHTAESSTDAAGNPVIYVPSNVIDGDVETAWRTPGDGHGESITLIFDNPITMVRIGLIPGYAKTDAQSGVNRFFQNRIITEVVYRVPGLEDRRKTFKPLPVPQFVRLRTLTAKITVKILGTTPPGGLDYTAISEIYVYGYPS
jgi:hypothetical protein